MAQFPRLTARTCCGEACCDVRLVTPSAMSRDGLPVFLSMALTLDQIDLPDMRKVEVGIERATAPDPPRLDATVIGRRDLDEIGRLAVLE